VFETFCTSFAYRPKAYFWPGYSQGYGYHIGSIRAWEVYVGGYDLGGIPFLQDD